MPRLLITSFRTWLADQASNSSDDLLELIRARLPKRTVLLRRLPVHADRAAARVRAAIRKRRPDVVVLCGMAARRRKLSVELRAREPGAEIRTAVDAARLVRGLPFTRVSRDAGRFVCEGLYFRVLAMLPVLAPAARGVFVHVPVLTRRNRARVAADFRRVVARLLHEPRPRAG
jgi:pyroglutamyl-peptidase